MEPNFLMSVLLLPALIGLIHACLGFSLAVLLRRNDVADVMWGPGILLMMLGAVAAGGAPTDRALLAATLIAIWATRLAWHIGRRNAAKGEDFRYRGWRDERGGQRLGRTFLTVFLLQAALAVIIVTPGTFIAAGGGGPLNLLDIAGLLVWAAGFGIEAVADRQLARFKSRPAGHGEILDRGLWRYSRHPNYFGEILVWWGLWIIALSVPYGVLSAAGPLLITFLLLRVSGVPLLEAKMRRDPKYSEYLKVTPVLVPGRPKYPSGPRKGNQTECQRIAG